MSQTKEAVGMGLRMPPVIRKRDGALRRVGVELEMNGLELDVVAAIVGKHAGGAVACDGRYERVVAGDPAGDWVVELDFDLLKKMGREQRDVDTLAGDLGNSAEDVLKWLAEGLVPIEVVSPPLPLDRLEELELLIAKLRDAGAKGSSDRLFNAFGMQFNPEIAEEGVAWTLSMLKAFLCLYDWLYARADIDMARRATTYIDPFPVDYVRRVVVPGYRPTWSQLIDDYLDSNPTRNRALDLLPLFAHVDEERVRARVDDVLVKARPALHYRLPDCQIHVPDWGVRAAWNDWVEVERLAADTVRLAACGEAYAGFLSRPLERWLGDWAGQVEVEWLGAR